MKFVLIPDSFKGTMSSKEICDIMAERITAHVDGAEIVALPVADGGEGSVDSFLSAVEGEKKYATVTGVFGEPMEGYYALIDEGKTAVIEMACCAGLPLAEGRLNPCTATTFGVGELLLAAAKEEVEHIILGLGGSATNDGGCGAAAALGVRFLDKNQHEFVPTGGTLADIESVDVSGISPLLKDIKITVMCDIDNPMYGENGAAYIFAPQKGADAATTKLLDNGLRHLDGVIRSSLGKDVSSLPGGGAAGAMGAGMAVFFDATLKMGIDVVLDTVNFDEQIKGADLIFTGEGKIDSQSLRGKVVLGVARRVKAQAGAPVVAVVGSIGEGISPAYDEGVSAIFSINTQAMGFESSRHLSNENLRTTMDNLLRFYLATR